MLFVPDLPCGRTSLEPSAPREGLTSGRSLRRSSALRNQTFMLLDLRPGAGNMLGPCWEYDPVWLGPPGTLNTSACPKDVEESSLSQILEASAPSKYYLTPAACLGILRRAYERGKQLPAILEQALHVQAGQDTDILAGTVSAGRVVDGFLGESSATAGSVGYEEERAPTMKAGGKSATVLCLNDQGVHIMERAEVQTGTLKAQIRGYEPLVFDNHGIDTRYSGPQRICSTVAARYGIGGNNTPVVTQKVSFCVARNAIDRQPYNGGNGMGVDEEISFTLTATDHHAVFNRQRTDRFVPDEIASTESARQHKDATDLVLNTSSESPMALRVRRLRPVECERLQGFPDGWTGMLGASDSARYKALGNSVAAGDRALPMGTLSTV